MKTRNFIVPAGIFGAIALGAMVGVVLPKGAHADEPQASRLLNDQSPDTLDDVAAVHRLARG